MLLLSSAVTKVASKPASNHLYHSELTSGTWQRIPSSNLNIYSWGECSPKRKGYRNGSYTRDLVTSSGRIEDIKVPRDRTGQFHTQAFERYSRYEPHIAEGLTQMFVAGTSTHKVGEVAQTLLGVAPSASTVSRLNQTLTQQFDSWRIL